MDRIESFRVFARVVESASFTRAAETLGMPRSSVSVAVSELETRLGALLLHRTTRKVTPTPDGEAFYTRCLRVIADVEEAEGLFRSGTTKPSGKLRIDVPARIGRLIVAPALPAFLAEYPDMEIALGVTDRAVNLVEEGIDCVLRVGPLSNSEMIARTIGSLSLLNVASPAYLAQHGRPESPDELSGHFAVKYASPSTGRVEPWEWVEAGAVKTRPMQGRVTVNGAEAAIACCLAGLGLIQIPAYDVRRHIQANDLVEVMPDHRAENMPMTLLYPHRRHLSRRVQLFADWIERLMRETITG